MPLNTTVHPCVENVNHSRVSVSEKGKGVTFTNLDRADFQKVRVDGCMVTSGARADWIISKGNTASVIVELKGRDVEHAVDQLFTTVEHSACKPWLSRPTKLLIICAKYPSFDTKVAKAQLRARKQGMSLKVVCKTFECRIEDL